MEKIFYWTLGISVVLLGISAVFLWISEKKKKKAALEAFRLAGATVTTRIDDLWMDEDKGLWLVAREGGPIPMHTYDDVLGATLSEDGVQYIWKKGEIRASQSDTVWPLVPDEQGRFNGSKRPCTIYLNIFVKSRECPVETVVLLTRPCKRTSSAYREAAAKTAALMRLFNTINDVSEPKKKKK